MTEPSPDTTLVYLDENNVQLSVFTVGAQLQIVGPGLVYSPDETLQIFLPWTRVIMIATIPGTFYWSSL